MTVIEGSVALVTGGRRGIGKAFMAAAERWALDHGYRSVSLSSNIARGEAHAFYEAIGYQRFASSHLFRKELPAG